MRGSVLIKGAQGETIDNVAGMQIEGVISRVPIVAGPVHRILIAAFLEASRQTRQTRYVFGPIDGESIAISVGRVVGQTRQGKIPFAVVRPRVTNGSRKVATAKNPCAEIKS